MTRNRNYVPLLGAITILLWASYIPYLFPTPFRPHAGVHHLAEEVSQYPEWQKEGTGVADASAAELEDKMMAELRRGWFQGLALTLLGVFAGISILRRKNYGRILAVAVASVSLTIRVIQIAKSYPRIGERLYALYWLFLQEHPVRVIHNDILAVALFLVTIVWLTRPSVAEQFRQQDFRKAGNGV